MFPVESVIPAIRASLARNRTVVLRAPPGSGKTTCVPPALLGADFLAGRKILMLEPRRLAARSCAAWIARRMGEEPGGTVGYRVRLEKRVSARTKLEIVTEGLLAQRLLDDPELADAGLVVFDEFHERSLACDLGFAMALDVRRNLRPDLRLLVMSATLDTDAVAAHLGDADVHEADVPTFPVETRYLKVPSSAPIAEQAAAAVRRARAADPEGSVLCFLPGEGEIRRCAAALGDLPEVRPLYGALPREEQDRAIAPGGRKIVLATSIAETSLTIPGVTTVVDCGLMRVSRFSPASGMSRLETLRLTRDRADQRRGRAGRVAPGTCLRLWTELEDRALLPAMKPEILEADLAPTALAAAAWGARKPEDLPWLTPPGAGAWSGARELLRLLGALDASGALTAFGRRMARIPAHPRLAAMMLRGGDPQLAAILEEGAPHGVTDVCDVRPTPRMRELARRWERLSNAPRLGAGEALALAFPDRVGKNRGNGSFQLSGGRGAFLERTEPLARADLVVCCDLDDRGGDAKIRLACAVPEESVEELFADEIRTETLTKWDPKTESVQAVRIRALGKAVLGAAPMTDPDPDAVARALFAGIRKKGVANLPCWTPALEQLRARILFVRRTFAGRVEWPDVSDAGLDAHLEDWFAGFVGGMSRWTHLANLDLAAVFGAALAAAGRDARELNRLAPTKMTVPSGSSAIVHYEEGEPFVQVRLQECFGMMDTPRVAGGEVPIVMKLLSPAQRPVQVTKDLAGFWRTSYALVRKDLRGRYPKHYWPEDPFAAVATRRVRPQKSEGQGSLA